MKWGRRKSSSTSSSVSKSSLFSSWLSKLKKMGTHDPVPEPQPEVHVKLDVNKEKGRHSWSSMGYLADSGGGKGEAFRRLSSGDEGFYGKKKSRGVSGPALNDDSNDEIEGPRSSFMSSRSNGVREEESGKFRDMVFSIKVKELPAEEKKEIEIKTPRKGSVKEMKFKNTHRRLLEERLSKIDRELEGEEQEEDTAPPVKTVQKYCYDYNLKTIEEDHVHAPPNCQQSGEVSQQKLSPGQEKLKELKLTTDKHRKSYYISRELQGQRTKQFSKVKVYSPRTPTKVEICKIRALEDLKRARLKTKKAKETTVLQSLAVVKCSFDPEKDFRDSMMEMILEESISKPEELEELLACYLTLNADEYHDLIIKVFRQVWLDMNDICFRGEGC